MKTLALIPARGGSKGVPRKNVRQLAGKPLIAWTIEAALASAQINRVVVSTEDDEIAEIGKHWGADIPFMRPRELAEDSSGSMGFILHALQQLPGYDAVLLLQPTSPLRTTADIDDCINLARDNPTNAVVSVSEARDSPYWMFKMGSENRLNKLIDRPDISQRQQLPAAYALNGAIYIAHTNWLLTTQTFMTPQTQGYLMPPERSLDIDTELDWKIAELLMMDSL